jgi:SAM-dependent methyltransferase
MSRGQVSASHFDHVAAVYDDSLPPHVVEHYLRKRVAFVKERCPPPARGLDVGCGTGALARRLADAGYEMTGIDPSEGMLEVLRARSPQVNPIKASGDEIPFESDTFELTISVAVMHHIAAPDAVTRTLAEMVRVVRPGGRIVVWDHNPRNPYWPRLMARVPQDSGEERLIDEQELIEGLERAGARILESSQLGLVPDFVPPRAMRLAAGAERAVERTPMLRLLCAHNVVVATK